MYYYIFLVTVIGFTYLKLYAFLDLIVLTHSVTVLNVGSFFRL
jgi:hypothetical protein